MRYQIKLFTFACLLLILLAVQSVSTMAATSLPTKETPIYLKMDQYFILYTQPSSPFLDKQNRLLIPLRSIQDLMGGTVSYNHDAKTATVQLLNRSFDLTINSKIASVDQTDIQMDTTPVLKNGAMFLPMRLFLDHANIEYKWVNDLQLLHITDKRVVKGKPFENFAGNDFTEGYVDGHFHLSAFKVDASKGISIKARNVTGGTVSKGKADIQPLVQFQSGGFSVDSYTRPVNKEIPAIQKGETVWVRKTIGLNDTAYIIAVGRAAP